MTRLSPQDYAALSDALSDCYDCDNGASDRTGSHFFLVHLLGTLGYRVHSWQAAEKLAKELLDA